MHSPKGMTCSECAHNNDLIHFLAAVLSSDEMIAPTEAIDQDLHVLLESDVRHVIEREFNRVLKHDPSLNGEALVSAFARTTAIFSMTGWPLRSEAAMCGAGSEAAMCGVVAPPTGSRSADPEGIAERLVRVLLEAA